MCCDNNEYTTDMVNGSCAACGAPTVDGESIDICAYSEVYCEVCGDAPCDESC